MKLAKGPGLRLIGIGAVLVLLLVSYPKIPRPNRGAMAIGTLIIFIAVILVAAIAASVLISAAGSYQQKALITGSGAREGISHGFEAISIRGSDPSSSGTPRKITNIYVMGRLPSGYDILNLNTTVMVFDRYEGSQTMTYGGVIGVGSWSSSTTEFQVTYLQRGPYNEDGYVNLGDTAKLKFSVDGTMSEGTRGRITLIPPVGNPNIFEFITPDSMTHPVEVLWPMS